MGTRPVIIVFAFMASFFLSSCTEPLRYGWLSVDGPTDQSYEIFRVESQSPLTFTGEKVAFYSQKVKLNVGKYLVLADCSHEFVTVKDHQTHSLKVHQIEFSAPLPNEENFQFATQCSRYEGIQLRQSFKNRFVFQVLSGQREMLVAMKPLSLNLSKSEAGTVRRFPLGAVNISSPSFMKRLIETPWFISPLASKISMTQPTPLGTWRLVLPGEYEVSLNGTNTSFRIGEGEIRVFSPGAIRIEVPKNVDLERRAEVTGRVGLPGIVGGHSLSYNTTIPLLAGIAPIVLDGYGSPRNTLIQPHLVTTISLRSVQLDFGCSPWEWGCLGKKEVMLFRPDQHYPFQEGSTDYPLLFEENAVHLGVEGSRDIRFSIPEEKRSVEIRTGYLELRPQLQTKVGFITDLARLESIPPHFSGHSLDIGHKKPTRMTLIAGKYNLATYQSATNPKGERTSRTRSVTIKPGRTTIVKFPFYISESQLEKLKKNAKNRIIRNTSARASTEIKFF